MNHGNMFRQGLNRAFLLVIGLSIVTLGAIECDAYPYPITYFSFDGEVMTDLGWSPGTYSLGYGAWAVDPCEGFTLGVYVGSGSKAIYNNPASNCTIVLDAAIGPSLTTVGDEIMISFWTNDFLAPGHEYLASNWDENGVGTIGKFYRISFGGSGLKREYRDDASSSIVSNTDATLTWVLREWYHIALKISRQNAILYVTTLYFDGEEVFSDSIFANVLDNGRQFSIGGEEHYSFDRWLDVDEVAVYTNSGDYGIPTQPELLAYVDGSTRIELYASPYISPSVTTTATNTNTVTASVTASSSRTASVTSSSSRTASVTASSSRTASATASRTASQSASRTGSRTATASRTASMTVTASSSATATNSATATSTSSASVSSSVTETSTTSATPSVSVTATVSATSTSSVTATPSESTTSTASPSSSATNTASASASVTNTVSPSLSASATGSVTSTASASISASGSPSQSATATASLSAGETPSSTPSTSYSSTASMTMTSSETATVTSTSSVSASSSASASETSSATGSSSQSGTISSTMSTSTSPSSSASATATGSATLSASSSETASSTASPSSTATSSVSETATSTASASASQSATVSSTVSASASWTATTSASSSATNTASSTSTPSATSSVSATSSATSSASASASATTSSTESTSPSATVSATSTSSSTVSATNTASPSSSATETATVTSSVSSSSSVSPTSSSTTTASSTHSASSSHSSSASATASASSTSSATNSVSATTSVSNTMSPSVSASVSATHTTSATETATTSASPSFTPTVSPTSSITASMTATISHTPTVTPVCINDRLRHPECSQCLNPRMEPPFCFECIDPLRTAADGCSTCPDGYRDDPDDPNICIQLCDSDCARYNRTSDCGIPGTCGGCLPGHYPTTSSPLSSCALCMSVEWDDDQTLVGEAFMPFIGVYPSVSVSSECPVEISLASITYEWADDSTGLPLAGENGRPDLMRPDLYIPAGLAEALTTKQFTLSASTEHFRIVSSVNVTFRDLQDIPVTILGGRTQKHSVQEDIFLLAKITNGMGPYIEDDTRIIWECFAYNTGDRCPFELIPTSTAAYNNSVRVPTRSSGLGVAGDMYLLVATLYYRDIVFSESRVEIELIGTEGLSCSISSLDGHIHVWESIRAYLYHGNAQLQTVEWTITSPQQPSVRQVLPHSTNQTFVEVNGEDLIEDLMYNLVATVSDGNGLPVQCLLEFSVLPAPFTVGLSVPPAVSPLLPFPASCYALTAEGDDLDPETTLYSFACGRGDLVSYRGHRLSPHVNIVLPPGEYDCTCSVLTRSYQSSTSSREHIVSDGPIGATVQAAAELARDGDIEGTIFLLYEADTDVSTDMDLLEFMVSRGTGTFEQLEMTSSVIHASIEALCERAILPDSLLAAIQQDLGALMSTPLLSPSTADMASILENVLGIEDALAACDSVSPHESRATISQVLDLLHSAVTALGRTIGCNANVTEISVGNIVCYTYPIAMQTGVFPVDIRDDTSDLSPREPLCSDTFAAFSRCEMPIPSHVHNTSVITDFHLVHVHTSNVEPSVLSDASLGPARNLQSVLQVDVVFGYFPQAISQFEEDMQCVTLDSTSGTWFPNPLCTLVLRTPATGSSSLVEAICSCALDDNTLTYVAVECTGAGNCHLSSSSSVSDYLIWGAIGIGGLLVLIGAVYLTRFATKKKPQSKPDEAGDFDEFQSPPKGQLANSNPMRVVKALSYLAAAKNTNSPNGGTLFPNPNEKVSLPARGNIPLSPRQSQPARELKNVTTISSQNASGVRSPQGATTSPMRNAHPAVSPVVAARYKEAMRKILQSPR